MELVRLLVEEGGAEVDSNGGEMIKDESDDNSQMMNVRHILIDRYRRRNLNHQRRRTSWKHIRTA